MATRGMAALLTAAAAVVAAAGYALYPHPEPLREGAGAKVPAFAQPTTILDDHDTLGALCAVGTAAVTQLLGGTKGTAQFVSLTNALPQLQQRITNLEAAATGRTGIQPVIDVAQGIYKDWTKALSSHNAGSDITGAKSLTSAASKIKTLDPAIVAALPASASC